MKIAKFLGKYRGKRYYRFDVKVSQSGVNRDFWKREMVVPVVAESPAAAVNLVRDEYWGRVSHPTEFETIGPKGGTVGRFIGWESLVAGQMFATRPAGEQLTLGLRRP